ncbi:MAG TPA: HD domain-containing phosphohydrolase [Fimbriimonadaceae bacterium]|nr:HD domain-containing phosphohydrolase [Fimbriimonadaceae bacterium]
MNQRILLVDDEANVLSAITRQLGDAYDLTTALGGSEGIAALEAGPEFAVVVADMRMPGMDGVQFLGRVQELSPRSIRMMLTGNADHVTAVKAVNEGNVFRFLNKPADKPGLVRAIDDCLAQFALVQAEKELLEKTLSGSIKVLVEILAIVNPTLFGKAQTLKMNAAKLAAALSMPDLWQIELAAMMCQIGSVAVLAEAPIKKDRLARVAAGHSPTNPRLPVYLEASEKIPLIGHSLISKIPRLETIAETILYQDQHFDGSGFPGDGRSGRLLPLGSRILKVLRDLDTLIEEGMSQSSALNVMRTRDGWYDPIVLQLAVDFFDGKSHLRVGVPVVVRQLIAGDNLSSDLTTIDGVLLVSAGQVLSDVGLQRLETYIGMNLLNPEEIVYIVERTAQAA